MRRHMWSAAGAILLLALAAGPVSARTAVPISIVADSPFAGAETFDSSLPGCASGTVTGDGRVLGSDHSAALVFDVHKTFRCTGGSTFDVHIHASVRPCDPQDRGSWVITGGTGGLEGLRGAGTLTGTYYPGDSCNADGVADHYSGVAVLP